LDRRGPGAPDSGTGVCSGFLWPSERGLEAADGRFLARRMGAALGAFQVGAAWAGRTPVALYAALLKPAPGWGR